MEKNLALGACILAALATTQYLHGDDQASCCSDPAKTATAPGLKPMAQDAGSALAPALKPVYASYLKIQAALAKDSLDGVAQNAGVIAKAAEGDSAKLLPADTAKQAAALAKAANLSAAREAFKPLSKSFIACLADAKVQTGQYVEAYCPMADASWLQTGKTVSNPYYGKSMSTCGEIKRTF